MTLKVKGYYYSENAIIYSKYVLFRELGLKLWVLGARECYVH